MTRAQLEEIGLTAEQVDAVIKANGKDIERERGKFADYDDVKAQLEKANATISGMADYDDVKSKVAEYKAQAEKASADAAAKIAQLEIEARVKDYTSGKRFVNDFTRDSINNALKGAVNDEANKGRSIEELFNAIVGDKTNILVDDKAPQPPTVPNMNGNSTEENGVLAAFQRLNPTLKL